MIESNNSHCSGLEQITKRLETLWCKANFSNALHNTTQDPKKKLQNEPINTAEFFLCVLGATKSFFTKMEFLEELWKSEENFAADDDDVEDHDNYNNCDLFSGEIDEKGYGLCSNCDDSPFAFFMQTCGHMKTTNCLKKLSPKKKTVVNYVDVEYPIT